MASVAKAYFGDVRFADQLLKANPHLVDPTALAPGTVLNIPQTTPLAAAPPPGEKVKGPPPTPIKGGQSYVVKAGDSLFGIAKDRLASGPRWSEIYALNKALIGNDPAKLKTGQVLTLPVK